jgi:putative ABC transport system substrate-binding protein
MVQPPGPAQQSRERVDRILKGDKPAELPVQAPVKYELAIPQDRQGSRHRSANDALLGRADEMIEYITSRPPVSARH